MAGVILVVNTPYVVRAGPDGAYRIDNLDEGAYRAIAWHPNAGADTTMVRLASGQRLRLDFSLVAAE